MVFKYNIVTLLELIEARPCLWDKSSEEYKDKLTRQIEWNEIFRLLEERYDELTAKEKKVVGDTITGKWVNIRDAFLKSLKTKPGQRSKKPYLYAHHLQFLLKCKLKRNTRDSLSNTGSSLTEQDGISAATDKTDDEYTEEDMLGHAPTRKKSKKVTMSKIKLENVENSMIEEIKIPEPQEYPDEKFFSSFVPYLKDMTESEKIDLQINILNCIKQIKDNRF